MARPTEHHNLHKVITFSNGDRMADLIRLLKGKVQTTWTQTGDTFEMSRVLMDEAYRQPFDELAALIRQRDAVIASMIHQQGLRPSEARR
jgi:hypothetical protein